MDGGLAVTAYWAAPNLLPPDAEDNVVFRSPRLRRRRRGRRGRSRDRRGRVLDCVTVHDAGRLLNPLLAEGQVRGGLAHGAAAALFERHVWDEDGNLLTGSFLDYLTPTAPDLPTRLGHRESPSPFLPLGARASAKDDDERADCDRERACGRPRARRRRAAVHQVASGSCCGDEARAVRPAAEVPRRGARGARRARTRRCSQADRASFRR